MKKQVLGHASKQKCAYRTTYFEVVKFHITGNDSEYDFTDIYKAFRAYNSGREISVYIERHGFTLRKGLSLRVTTGATYSYGGENCGLSPAISQKWLGTWSAKAQPITEEELTRLINKHTKVNTIGDGWHEECNF